MNSVQPDYLATLAFLRVVHPDRLWTLTGILPDTIARVPTTVTATFDASREDECLAWLHKFGVKRNLYWSVAEPLTGVTKKLERSDVKAVHLFHCDIDPNTGEPLDTEQARILAMLTGDTLPDNLPSPTIIVNSGGGFQALWKLATPIEIAGDVAKAEAAKLHNLTIELALGADSCHDVTRILRLPGTVNRPSEKKRKRGRVEALARVVACNVDRVYTIDRFPPTQLATRPVAAGVESSGNVKTAVNVNAANIVRLATLDDLPPSVLMKTKEIINNGVDPFDPMKHGDDRSKWLRRVVCDLVRAKVSDDVIYSVITDTRFLIAASVLDKGSGTDRYARRQIARATAEVNEPDLAEMNERYTFIREFGGKPVVVWGVNENIGRDKDGNDRSRVRLVKMSPDTFNAANPDRRHVVVDDKGNQKAISLTDWWMKHPLANRYDRIQFAPEQQLPPDVMNLWTGFAVNPKPGDWSLFRDHIRTIICSGSDAHFDYLIRWMANAVHHPHEPGYAAIVLKGGEGIGKGVFASLFGSLFGRHFMQISDERYISGNFNGHLLDCVLLFADEAFYAGSTKHASTLKRLVTEDNLTIENKGVDPIVANNCLHLIMASNEAHVVPAGVNARRFFVLKVSEARQNDYAYFTAITDQMSNGGLAAMLHDLKTMDLSGFNVRHVPKTDELADQKARTMSRVESILYEAIAAGRLPCGEKSPANAKVKNSPFTEVRVEPRDLIAWFNADRIGSERLMNNSGLRSLMAAWLKLEACESNGRTFYRFPPLGECRAAVEKHLQQRIEWPKVIDLDERSDEQQTIDARQPIGREDQTGWVVEVPSYNF